MGLVCVCVHVCVLFFFLFFLGGGGGANFRGKNLLSLSAKISTNSFCRKRSPSRLSAGLLI